ncbi:hypothetical protein ASPSYDRAFT_1089675 [Aspergillus sydowii CBS 593.65]|uniref:Uncharacterized protein n=1 Tax=Aspergillus sydowii CBS 593.65 TaxID=1036612 RepID=A0A1L9T1J3_9EURO|nr:uncharacterized protein ASPSYDRAFT_559556 [Aspergillus sydowii CBS 593.65]XP_040700569.1 uncharacterized protein ASPSYDRAFT_1089675 [Aspergillus sydowii CBS 593.65]OJJ53279.1 hypothetical protein ASPSYDRAFT_559556 [Aspergillus sydowii CBS 593.65]OJJ56763.1 hypothetical protein ASPSYDRAFT_1089675 [Aspergillus sydowii CBS 593.65]
MIYFWPSFMQSPSDPSGKWVSSFGVPSQLGTLSTTSFIFNLHRTFSDSRCIASLAASSGRVQGSFYEQN